MVFGYETGTINVIVPDNIRFSSTLIFFTELILVFSALFIISVLAMVSIQILMNRYSLNDNKTKNKNKNNINNKQTQLLSIPSHESEISDIDETSQPASNINFTDHNIFHKTVNKRKNIMIWSYFVFLTSLITTMFYLLMYTTIITPSDTFTCTNLLQIGNILLILSRFALYIYWNEYLLYSTSVYLSYYIYNNDLFTKQFPDLKPIKSLATFKKRMANLQHDLDQHIHNRYSDGEQYLYYKVFYKYYIYRFFIILWVLIYLIGLIIYTDGENIYLTIDSNNIDEDGTICKEIFDTLSIGMVFYTFGMCCDIMTILHIIEEYIISFSNNLLIILKNEQSLNKNMFVILNMKKNITLVLISMFSTLLFRLLSFASGLEATLYPLGYTINILMVFLMFPSNGVTYKRCCSERIQMERSCFFISFTLSKCCCRYNYGEYKTKSIHQRLKQSYNSHENDVELQITEKNFFE